MTNRRTIAITATALAGLSLSAIVASPALGSDNDHVQHASATIIDLSGAEIGFAAITEDGTGRVHVNVKVDGLTAGLHGIHIHATGSCANAFAAAQGHHNPGVVGHGQHSGDLPNLSVNGAGRGTLNAATTAATLTAGATSVFDGDGSAIIIHANPDDFMTQPTGNSGGRVACGVIVAD